MKKPILVLFVLLLPFTVYAQMKTPKTTQQQTMSSPSGRYVFSQVSEYRRDQYLLDTQTGRLWQIVSEAEGKPIKLQPIPYMQIFGDEAYIPDPIAEVEAHRKFIRKKTIDELNSSVEPDKSN